MFCETTEDCKNFIKKTIDENPILQQELNAHDVNDWSQKRWARRERATIKEPSDYLWLVEHATEFGAEAGWVDPEFVEFVTKNDMSPGYYAGKDKDLVKPNYITRGYLYRGPADGDAYFGIVTNGHTGRVVAWSFQCD